MTNIVVTGASRGLGLALTRGLANPGDRAWLISRTEPPGCEGLDTTWIPLDLAVPEQLCKASLDAIGNEPIHLLIHSAGIWEPEPFDQTSPQSLLDILNVNVNSAVLLVRLLEKNLREGHGNVVFIGSTWGLENSGTGRVASAASKFGLRGATHALREHFREAGVRVTCINSGWFSTDSPREERTKAFVEGDSRPIPVADLVEMVRCISKLSDATCVKELLITPTTDPDV
jgi:NAD(P)-dependent dehydrogenase (short-subunit alcohol dehydrogenase family)